MFPLPYMSFLSLVLTARGLAKLRVARGLHLWTVVGGIRTVVPFLRHVALQIHLQRSSERVKRRRLASLMSELFTSTTRETTDALISPPTTYILPVPTTGKNANHGRNLWKDRMPPNVPVRDAIMVTEPVESTWEAVETQLSMSPLSTLSSRAPNWSFAYPQDARTTGWIPLK
ncbi:hypothetical protein AVEN_128492-1 [Araneus ventricosus]|uniref:Uncharacterized protein n=1 Tax=Araneus ventricosus TaxID=182803 RepID=A0A4Y2FQ55_ARAVE|nr:hypothetical protein AVEN_128492-1 [Araneus ventricosus]